MRHTIQERFFVYFIMALIALVLLFVVAPAEATECTNAHKTPCPDLVGAEVTFKKIGQTRYESVCGDDTHACAVLNVTQKQCTIYYRTRFLEQEVIEHELNHCRGWFHPSDRKATYSRPWVDLTTYLER